MLLAGAAPALGAQATTRVFAMQPKSDLTWMKSRQTFHDKLFALGDRSLRGAAAPVVQAGADDVASHLRGDGRNLVVWPEDIGLWAAFTGARGDAARGSGSLVGMVVGLFTTYAPQMSYYAQLYPEVAARAPQVRLLALSLTDTFGRVALETFSEMAAKYHVWLVAGVDMAQSWRVVCTGGAHPPQQSCDEENPAKVRALGDPGEPGRGYAYEATSPDASNMALVFDPSGRLVSKQIKEYLTPIELGQAEGQLAALDLVPGPVTSGLTPVATPVGMLGFVTSKDAWMPDVLDRLEAGHVDLLLQPEYFVGDVASDTGMWAMDTLKASGYSDLLRHPGFQSMALPSMVGNVADFTADAQSLIAERPSGPRGGRWLIGQPPSPGMIGVTPWVVPDPVRNGESFAERRRRLAAAGKKLVPGSGVKCPDAAKPGACENGHVETVLWRDVPVGVPAYRRLRATRVATAFSRAHPLGRGRAPQRNAAIALAGRYGALAYEERAGARDRVMLATSRDGGRRWSAPRAVEAGGFDQWWPAVAVDGHGVVTAAWTSLASGTPRVVFAQTRAGARAGVTTAPQPVDPGAPAGAQWKPALAQGPGGVVHAAFVDTRARSADGNLPQAGIFYTRIVNGTAAAATRMDTGPPDALATKLDNAWAPRIAVHGRDVLVTWLDFMHYDWDVLSRLSHDGGAGFAAQVDSNREPAAVEDLSDSPQPVFTSRGPLIAWTDFHKRDSSKAPHRLYDIYVAAPGREPVQADPYGARQVSTFWPAACAAGRDALIAFQDSATGVARVRIVRMRSGAKRGRAARVNDSAAGAYRPVLACANGRVVVAWEDARSGTQQVYTAFAPAHRVR